MTKGEVLFYNLQTALQAAAAASGNQVTATSWTLVEPWKQQAYEAVASNWSAGPIAAPLDIEEWINQASRADHQRIFNLLYDAHGLRRF